MNKILITWWTWRLGKACKKIFPDALYPSSKDMDITNIQAVDTYISKHQPDYIIHLAALAWIPDCENNKQKAWDINVEGTKNLLHAAKKYNVSKFLYLQTACIFSWEDAPYDEQSLPNPKHYYGFTKAITEEIVKSYNTPEFTTLIARTNFTTMPWEYENAFTDRFGTYLFAQWVAKWLQDFIEHSSPPQVIHICWERKLSMHEYATLWWSAVWKMTTDDYTWVWLTKDMSLITKDWQTYKIEDSNFNDN